MFTVHLAPDLYTKDLKTAMLKAMHLHGLFYNKVHLCHPILCNQILLWF